MRFRLASLVLATFMLVVFYALMSSLIVRKIFIKFVGYSAFPDPPPWLVQSFMVGIGLDMLWALIELCFYWSRQRNRCRRGYCACCGRMLGHDMLRCLHCGTKVTSPRRVEPRFEVVIRDWRSSKLQHHCVAVR